MHRLTKLALRTLYNQRCIGAKHMRYDLLRKRWKHETREEQRTVENELKNSACILWKQSLGERHLSIDPRRMEEVEEALEQDET